MLRPLVPAPRGELSERGCEAVHRVFSVLRIGDVALHTVHREPAAERAAAPNLDRGADPLLARGRTDHAPVDALSTLAQGFRHPLGAINRGAFLVARDQKAERAAVLGAGADKRLGGRDDDREASL